MSFYDDASLVFLPSGGAGKDGKAYSIKPVPEYGNELVTNGGFDTDSDWSKGTGWSIGSGVATANNVPNLQRLQQGVGTSVIGKTYKYSLSVSNVSGFYSVYIFGVYVLATVNTEGTFEGYVTATSTNGAFWVAGASASGLTAATIDNVSVKEVIVEDGDFTFSRGSNLTATRIDSNGLIEKGRENLLFQSNQFDTTWVINNASVTSGQAGYDGSNNAWLLQASGTTSYLIQNISASNGYVYTQSIYAKSGNTDFISLTFGSGISTKYAIFNLSNGTIDTDTGFIDSTIQSVGNGWYRCSISVSSSTTGSNGGLIATPSRSGAFRFAAVVGDNVLIQSAQTEIGLVATEYIESGASKGKAGILEDSPRFDYSGGASCASLLLEPSRTNLIPHSEYHSAYTYSNNFVSVSDNQAISPQGVQNAAKIILDSGTNSINGGHYYVYTSTSSEKYTISVFAKAAGYRYFTFTYGSTNAAGGHFDLQEGVKLGDITNAQYTNTSASIEDYGNGWYRLIVSVTDTSSAGRYLSMRPSPSASVPSNNNYSSTGDGTSGAYIYGLQLEANASYPTSYIPNHSGGSVTRAADAASVTGVSSLIGQNEGTLFLEVSAITNDSTNKRISISDGTNNNRVLISFSTTLVAILVSGGAVSVSSGLGISSVEQNHKIAFSYSLNNFKVYVDGTEVLSDTLGDTFSGALDRVQFADGSGSLEFYGNAKQLIVFNTALSTADLEVLTGATSYDTFSAMATALNYTTYE